MALSETPSGEVLPGGNMGDVVRIGATVRRPTGEWTPRVHALLRHLRGRGVLLVPDVHGVDDRNREILDFVEGEVPQYPMPDWVWTDRVLTQAAAGLRSVHDASVGFEPAGPWRSPVHEPVEVICLNDVAPYNMVFRNGSLVSFIDVDFASPGPRAWDLAYLAYRLVPLSEEPGGARDSEERRRRLRLLLDAYGSDLRNTELLAVVETRLIELAEFTAGMAEKSGRPDLRQHAELYRRDAERVRVAAAEERD